MVGTLVHDLLQTMIKKDVNISHESVNIELDTLLRKSNYLLSIWANQDTVSTIKSDVQKYVPNVVEFASGIKINDRKLLVYVTIFLPKFIIENYLFLERCYFDRSFRCSSCD